MNKVKIYYFSGTGNTKYVVGKIKSKFEEKNIECNILSIEKSELSLENYDLLGISYPIYGFAAPHIIIDWAKKLPKAKNSKVFIISTAADYVNINNNNSSKLIKILEKKGYEIIYDRIIVMPCNWIFRYKKILEKSLIESLEDKVEDICNSILNKKIRRYKPNVFIKILTNIISYFESNIGATSFGISLKVSNSCNKCGKCINECPTNNIKLVDNKLKFGSNCQWCMRCIYSCNKSAIYSRGMSFSIIKEGYNVNEIIESKSNSSNKKQKKISKHFLKYLGNPKI